MRSKVIFLQLLLSVFLVAIVVSCKNESKKESEIVNNKFKVTLNLLLKKNDTLHVYYTEDNTIGFKEESSIWVSALGKEVPQDVVFELPEDVFPTQFRFDLGVNPANEKIIFQGVTFNYLDKAFVISESSIFNYFRVNTDNTNFDTITKELSRKNPSIDAGPCLYPLEIPLKAEIDKLVK